MVMRKLGEPSLLEAAGYDDPRPGAGEITIDVAAIGCNFSDVLICQGKYQLRPPLPFSPGSEVAGHVRELGPGVSGFRVGEAVSAHMGFGGYASIARADVRRVQRIPDGVPMEDACALGVAYQTAYVSLVDRAQLRAAETLLVQAAAGGVGLAALQLGRALGARVIAAASGDKLALCRAHGADLCVDTRADDWPTRVREMTQQRGADVILESVGGEVFDGSLASIAWGGRLAIVGFSSGRIPTPKMNRVLLKQVALLGVNLGSYHEHDAYVERMRVAAAALFELYRQGSVRPHISHRYPLTEAGEALSLMAARRSVGKLLLVP
jgi:NADPH2:quinone reductase